MHLFLIYAEPSARFSRNRRKRTSKALQMVLFYPVTLPFIGTARKSASKQAESHKEKLVGGLLALTKNHGAYAHDGASLFYSDGIIVGHAFRYLTE